MIDAYFYDAHANANHGATSGISSLDTAQGMISGRRNEEEGVLHRFQSRAYHCKLPKRKEVISGLGLLPEKIHHPDDVAQYEGSKSVLVSCQDLSKLILL